MTSIGKVFTVVLAIASVLFMTAALAVVMTGPNWLAKADQVEGYAFSRSGGENPQWTATDVATGDPVKSAANLADVIPAALDAKVTAYNTELTALRDRKQNLDNVLQVSTATAEQDATLLAERIERLRQRIASVRDQTVQTAGQLANLNEQIGQVEAVVAARRGDVFRLRAVLDQAELDAVRAERLRGQLADLIVQLDADLDAARDRRDQLREQLGVSDGPQAEPAAGQNNADAARTAEAKSTGDAL